MKKKYPRNYELYYSNGIIKSRSSEYVSGLMWVCQVRAKSIKQAYYLLANKKEVDESGCGIVSVDNSSGPSCSGHFPFQDSLYPKHWKNRPSSEQIDRNIKEENRIRKVMDDNAKNGKFVYSMDEFLEL